MSNKSWCEIDPKAFLDPEMLSSMVSVLMKHPVKLLTINIHAQIHQASWIRNPFEHLYQ